MKKIAIAVIAAAVTSMSMPALSQQSHQEKISCELAAQNCLNQVDILQKRVKKLNTQIKKGIKTYSPEELKKLEQKLQETKELLDKLDAPAPAK